MIIFETYEMITPKKGALSEYEQFYFSYGQTIKMNLLINQMLKEIKEKLPVYFLEIMESIERRYTELEPQLLVIGLQKIEGEREKYERNIGNSDYAFIKDYFDGDIGKYIDFYTNKQTVISIHTLFESSIIEYVRRKENNQKLFIRQDKLLSSLFSNIGFTRFNKMFEQLHKVDFTEEYFNKLWCYYTNIRNLYAHTDGFISQRFKDVMNGCSSLLKKFAENDMILECSLFHITDNDFFQLNNIKVKDLFCINEINCRYFLHFLVYIWETIYAMETQLTDNKSNKKYIIVDNTFEFKLYSSSEDYKLMQTMPETLTNGLSKFIINGYKCPNCKNDSIFLYKATPGKDFDVSLIANNESNEKYKSRKVFTCPNCKSFFFSSYGGFLSDNKGFNIMELNDFEYFILLKKFNKI